MTRGRDKADSLDLEARIGHDFADPALLGTRADPCQRVAGPARSAVPAAGVSRRPRARPRRAAHALRRLSERRARANCRAASPRWCARRPAPKSRSLGRRRQRCGSARARPRPADAARRALLGDICEAIIGAAFLDGGYAAAERIVRKRASASVWRRAATICATPRPPCRNGRRRAGSRRRRYRVVGRTGPDHAPFFEVAVRGQGFGGAADGRLETARRTGRCGGISGPRRTRPTGKGDT